MTAGIRWGNKGEDITSLSSGVWTQGKISLSRLRVNYTTAKEILSESDCSRQNEASRTVKCDNTFICVAFYSSLALRLEPAYETAVVTVQLRKLTLMLGVSDISHKLPWCIAKLEVLEAYTASSQQFHLTGDT